MRTQMAAARMGLAFARQLRRQLTRGVKSCKCRDSQSHVTVIAIELHARLFLLPPSQAPAASESRENRVPGPLDCR